MADATFEQVLKAIISLPPEERARIREWLADEERERSGQTERDGTQPVLRREREMRWLGEHEAEYAGEWVALDGDRLLSHGSNARKGYAEAHAAGVEVPFVAYAEDPNDFQWGGWL